MLEYLVQYGRSSFVGRFVTAEVGPLKRGQAVVVHSPRGIEVGTVLASADRFASQVDPAAGGELLRELSTADHAQQYRLTSVGRDILAAAERTTESVSFLDIEMMLDGSSAILHALPWGTCDLDPLLADLSAHFNLHVRLMDMSRTPTVKDPPESSGCGKPGCGTESGGGCGTSGGGCSTGSCSKGKVKSAAELTDYFADLRGKMEAAGMTRTALN